VGDRAGGHHGILHGPPGGEGGCGGELALVEREDQFAADVLLMRQRAEPLARAAAHLGRVRAEERRSGGDQRVSDEREVEREVVAFGPEAQGSAWDGVPKMLK
jgi:hypothetical protein